MKCKHGYGQESTYKDRCDKSCNKCPALRKKNSKSMQLAHKEGRASFDALVRAARSRQGQTFYRIDPKEIFVENSGHVKLAKRYLVKERGHKCEKCNGAEWLGLPMPIQLHHKNGKKKDCRRKNLELLCANCHTQTDNWTSKNSKAYKAKLAYSETAITAASEAVI